MKESRGAVLIVLLLAAFFSSSSIVFATPSTTYWTPMTPDIQSSGVLHLGIDNYFTVFKKQSGGSGSFPTDVGLTMGVLPFEKIQMEVGVDLLEPSDDPLFFNAKIGSPEGALFSGSPALQVGIFNVGTKRNSTDQNIFYGVIGKTIPLLGRLSVGPYVGNSKVLLDSEGHKENTGFMVAFDHGFLPAKDKSGDEYSKIVLAADYASGKNAIGGGGMGLYYYFTKNISFLTGPVWFNNQAINGRWKWTTQIDINIDLFK
ncbi:MAG: hypothetical protein U0411_08250 [Thermodesulfovibrionales bacterium]